MGMGGRIAFGLMLAFITQFLAFLLAGAGHGWVAPFFASMALWLLIPATFAIGHPDNRSTRLSLLVIAALALVADAWLINTTLAEGSHLQAYAAVNGAIGWLIIGLWLALWVFWQAIALFLLMSRRRADVAA